MIIYRFGWKVPAETWTMAFCTCKQRSPLVQNNELWLLGELAKLEFGKSVHWKGQRVHFDRNTLSMVKENYNCKQN